MSEDAKEESDERNEVRNRAQGGILERKGCRGERYCIHCRLPITWSERDVVLTYVLQIMNTRPEREPY